MMKSGVEVDEGKVTNKVEGVGEKGEGGRRGSGRREGNKRQRRMTGEEDIMDAEQQTQ